MLKKLYDSHRQLEASAERLSTLIGAAVPDAEAVQAARWDIAKRIMQHLALEDRHLFANLAKDKRPGVTALAARFQADFAQYLADYADHAKQWTAERVLTDWDEYRARTHEQLRLLHMRIRKVETELFPLASDTLLDSPQNPTISWAREAFAIKDSITGATNAGGSRRA